MNKKEQHQKGCSSHTGGFLILKLSRGKLERMDDDFHFLCI
ncbi:hypothetical protein SAMN05421820_102164 [Pedobacter steynii]|uniref:Uncharacterized protein n=1 Tax=Pedobacter steynii TaxID=430522 RepID=A0A1G9MZI4_9SPHI|nr:hypothetical protein SAMN05421820_102164 [Pedobacter steynii]